MNQIFQNGIDDYMFPTTPQGQVAVGIFESVSHGEAEKNGTQATGVFEAALNQAATSHARAEAMAAVLAWANGDDHTYDNLDDTILIMSGVDDEKDAPDEDEQEAYSDVWQYVPDAMTALGASSDDAMTVYDGPGEEANAAATRVATALAASMEEIEADDDELIASFSLGTDAILESCQDKPGWKGILEATFKKKKVVRDGKVQLVNKRISGRVRLSSDQKAALKKAQRKAQSATAKVARRKSMKRRKAAGL